MMMKSRVSICVVMLLAAANSAAASNFTVTPTEINFSPGANSALVTLRNTGKTTLRFEITAFRWSEDDRGAMTLLPSNEVTFFPKLVELRPGTSRNIRIGVNNGVVRDVEQSFRLFVEELPDESAPIANAVAIRTKMGLPVFVRPVKAARSAAIDSVEVKGGRVLTRVRNTGNLHINVENIVFNGSSASKAQSFSKTAPGWYVLPGGTRVFEATLTPEECEATTSVAVELFGHNTSLKGMGQVAPAACVSR